MQGDSRTRKAGQKQGMAYPNGLGTSSRRKPKA